MWSMQRPDFDLVADILTAARLVRRFVQGVGYEEFMADVMRQSAVIRQLEIIGEAARHLSPEFTDLHAEVPWRKMVGMRNMLIHAYRSVDEDVVWNAAMISVPDLLAVLEPLVQEHEEGPST